jgi:hypothetical protein
VIAPDVKQLAALHVVRAHQSGHQIAPTGALALHSIDDSRGWKCEYEGVEGV